MGKLRLAFRLVVFDVDNPFRLHEFQEQLAILDYAFYVLVLFGNLPGDVVLDAGMRVDG